MFLVENYASFFDFLDKKTSCTPYTLLMKKKNIVSPQSFKSGLILDNDNIGFTDWIYRPRGQSSKDLDQSWHMPCIFYSMIQNYSHEEP